MREFLFINIKRISVFLTVSLFFHYVYCQDTMPVSKKLISNSTFADCYVYKNGLAALAGNGKIYQINFPEYSFSILSPYNFATISTDRNGLLWAVDSFSQVFTLRDTGWHREKMISTHQVWGITFTQSNTLLLITDLGIYNSKTEMFYGINKYRHFSSSFFAKSKYRPACYYMDKKDKLWISGYSRIINELHVFSAKKNHFITSKLKGLVGLRDTKSIFGFKNTIFFANLETIAGMSAIYSYHKDTMRRIHHYEYDTMSYGPPKGMEEYIGAAFFDEQDRSIYYYTNKGLLKAKYNTRKNIIETPKRIVPPIYIWNGYNMESDRFAMLVEKIFRYQDLIIYLNKEEGIFVTDGRKTINLK